MVKRRKEKILCKRKEKFYHFELLDKKNEKITGQGSFCHKNKKAALKDLIRVYGKKRIKKSIVNIY